MATSGVSFSFNKYLLSVWHIPDATLRSEGSVMNMTQFMFSWSLDSGREMSAVRPVGLGAVRMQRAPNSVLEGTRRVPRGSNGQVAIGRLSRN